MGEKCSSRCNVLVYFRGFKENILYLLYVETREPLRIFLLLSRKECADNSKLTESQQGKNNWLRAFRKVKGSKATFE